MLNRPGTLITLRWSAAPTAWTIEGICWIAWGLGAYLLRNLIPATHPAGTGHLPIDCRLYGELAILNICRAKFHDMVSPEYISLTCPSCERTTWGLLRLQTKPNCGPERRASWRRPIQGANGRVVKMPFAAPLPFSPAGSRGKGLMKVYTAIAAFAASPAFGHLGHVSDTATVGHSHWLVIGWPLVQLSWHLRSRLSSGSGSAQIPSPKTRRLTVTCRKI